MFVCFCKNKEDFLQAETINEKGEVIGGLVNANYEFTRPLSCLDLTGGMWKCVARWEQYGDSIFEFTKYWELDKEHFIVSPFEVEHGCSLLQFSQETGIKFKDVVKHWHLDNWYEEIDWGKISSVDRSFVKDKNPPGTLIEIQWECKTLHIRELFSLFIPDNWVHNWCD